MTKREIPPVSLEAILIFLVIFTPLFYGSLEPGPLALAQLITLLFLGLFAARVVLALSPKITYPAHSYLLFIFLLIAIFQIIPLPKTLVKMISPRTVSIWQAYGPNGSQAQFLSIAFYRLIAKREIIKFISYFIVFFGTVNLIKKRNQFQRLLLVIIFWGLVLSFYGLIRKYHILNKGITGSFSSFGNRNHFAGYMVMIVPLTVGYALACKDRLVKFLISFVAAVISAAIFLSLSRAGSVSLILSLLAMAFFLKREKIAEGKHWIIIAIIVLSMGLILIPGVEPIKQRFFVIARGFLGRLEIAKNSLAIIKDFPVFGVGLGSFGHIFAYYQRLLSSSAYFVYLHNDHLQLVVEVGLLGSFFYFAFIYKMFASILKKLKQRQDIFAKYITLGGFCGLLGVIVHSFFEFNFHIPATGFLFWLILALIYKCVDTHFYSTDNIS